MKTLLLLFLLIFWFVHVTLSQTIPTYVPSNGLLGWWPFNSNAVDESGNGNNGFIDGAILTEDRFENTNSAFDFNGPSSIVTDTIIGWKQQISVSYWFRPNELFQSSTYRQDLLAGNYTLPIPFQIYYQEGRIVVELWDYNNYGHFYYSSNTNFNPNTWSHIVLSTKVNSIVYLSINGTTDSIGIAPASLRVNPTVVLFGRSIALPSYYYNGKLDDIGIWSRALTTDETLALYQSDSQNNLSTISNTIDINIFPNPTCSYLNINIDNNIKVNSLRISNTLGQVVYTSLIENQSFSVDLSNHIKKGIYFLNMFDSDNRVVYTEKIVLK